MKTLILRSFTFLLIIFSTQISLAQGSKYALQFDGTNDYVLFNNDNRGITNQLTISAWVKTTSTKYHWIVGKYDREEDRGYHLFIRDGKAAFGGRDGSSIYRTSGYSINIVNDNKWHHITGVLDKGTWKIYVDGLEQSVTQTGNANSNVANSAPLAIGKDYLANNEQFDGAIDEVRIWKWPLRSVEIQGTMCQRIAAYPSHLVTYINFDEGTGNQVKDQSSLKLDGSLTNMATSSWIVSGAPIGDRSTSIYGSGIVGQKYSVDDGGKTILTVEPVGTNTKGIVLYYIGGMPDYKNGLTISGNEKGYFGIFTPLYPDANHKLSFKIDGQNCNNRLYEREDNSVQFWQEVAVLRTTETATGSTNISRGEYFIYDTSAQQFDIAGNRFLCAGGSTQLSVNTTAPVVWSNGSKTNTITVTEPGIYEVSILLGYCLVSSKVEVKEFPLPVFSLGADKTVCYGEKTILSAPDNMKSYRWSTGAITSKIEVSGSGTYWVEVTNDNGCLFRDEININVKQDPVISVPQTLSACYGETVTLTASAPNASYRWSTGQTTASINVTAPADLEVTIFLDGCEYVRKVKVSADECPTIPNIITPNGDGKNDTFVLTGLNIDNIHVEIFNRWGKSIYRSTGYKNDWAPVTNGIYYYHIKSGLTQKDYKGWVEVVK